MIQRIQSLYLALAIILLMLLIKFPYSSFVSPEGKLYELGFYGLISQPEGFQVLTPTINISYPILITIIILLCVVAIFFYKKRNIQVKICHTILVSIIILAIAEYTVFNEVRSQNWKYGSFTIYSYIPYIAGLLVYLARNSIRKDEELVKSIDRIR